MKRPEEALHRQVAAFLRLTLADGAWFCHPANGGARTPAEAGILKAMGVRAGTPDLLIVHAGRAIWIELKAQRGTVSAQQAGTMADLRAAGCPVYVCRSLDDVIAALHEAEVPTRARAA